MVKKIYKPEQGDIVFLDFNPQQGHEQHGRRSALVVSENIFNEKTGLALVCPITTKSNKFPLHFLIPPENKTIGFVLAEHVRSVDFRARNISFIEKVDCGFLKYILEVLKSFYN